jgi:hypothetical protein
MGLAVRRRRRDPGKAGLTRLIDRPKERLLCIRKHWLPRLL